MIRVRVAEGRQVVNDAGEHSYGGDVLAVEDTLGQQWVRLGYAEPVDPPAEDEAKPRTRRR